MNLNELQQAVAKLHTLLENPQPGLWTWVQAVQEQIRVIASQAGFRCPDPSEQEKRAGGQGCKLPEAS